MARTPFLRITVDDKELRKGLTNLHPAYQAGLKEATKAVREATGRLFESATSTWSKKSKPTVKDSVNVSTSFILETMVTGWVEVEGEIFDYVNRGTRPHMIFAKNAKALRFQSGYTRKTAAHPAIAAQPGGPHGDYVYRRAVHHPGTEAQDIVGRVLDKMDQDAEGIAKTALEKKILGKW